jgi:hypothetical protein
VIHIPSKNALKLQDVIYSSKWIVAGYYRISRVPRLDDDNSSNSTDADGSRWEMKQPTLVEQEVEAKGMPRTHTQMQ